MTQGIKELKKEVEELSQEFLCLRAGTHRIKGGVWRLNYRLDKQADYVRKLDKELDKRLEHLGGMLSNAHDDISRLERRVSHESERLNEAYAAGRNTRRIIDATEARRADWCAFFRLFGFGALGVLAVIGFIAGIEWLFEVLCK